MAERDGQGIGLVFGDRAQQVREEAAHHEGHLALGRGALPHDGHLHLRGGVLEDRGAAPARGEEDDAADVTDLQRGQGALADEGRFDRDLVGRELVEEGFERVVDGEQAVGKREDGARRDGTGALVADPAPLQPDQAIAGGATAGVDAEDERPRRRGGSAVAGGGRLPPGLGRPAAIAGVSRGVRPRCRDWTRSAGRRHGPRAPP